MLVILSGAQRSEESLFQLDQEGCFAKFALERSEGLSMTPTLMLVLLHGG